MILLYWKDETDPSYWFTAEPFTSASASPHLQDVPGGDGHGIVVGRKGSDVEILNDTSISRCHVIMSVMWGDGGIFLRITDFSKYGTHVGVMPDSSDGQRCPQGLLGHGIGKISFANCTFRPLDQTTFDVHPRQAVTVRLGTHDSRFTLRWYQPRVYTDLGCELNQRQKDLLQHIDCQLVKTPVEADFVVTDGVTPNPGVLASLCAGIPLVSFDYIGKLCRRSTPREPPDDPTAVPGCVPPLDKSWLALYSDCTAQTFLPNRQRLKLFDGATFLCLSQLLYDEAVLFLPLANAHVVVDTALDAGEEDVDMYAFRVRHSGHIAILSHGSDSLVAQLRELSIRTVQYDDLVRAVVMAKPMHFVRQRSELTSEAATRSAKPSSPSDSDDEEAAASSSPVNPIDCIRKEKLFALAELPDYPCFRTYVGRGKSTSQKTFRKQQLLGHFTAVERFSGAQLPRNMYTISAVDQARAVRGVLDVDDDDVVPEFSDFDRVEPLRSKQRPTFAPVENEEATHRRRPQPKKRARNSPQPPPRPIDSERQPQVNQAPPPARNIDIFDLEYDF